MIKKIILATGFTVLASQSNAGLIYLDGDTAATGLGLGSSPMTTSFGDITFRGEFRTGGSDPEFVAAGSTGNVFDIDGSSTASFTFDFDVTSFSFIFGGNTGSFDVVAKDSIGNIVDSFFQQSTNAGQFAGPVALVGQGIRSIEWNDIPFSYAPMDNITIMTASVPEPATTALLIAGLAGVVATRKAKNHKS